MTKSSLLLTLGLLLPLTLPAALPETAGRDGRTVRFEIHQDLQPTPLALNFSLKAQNSWSAADETIAVNIQTKPLGALTEWRVSLQNKGTADLRVQPQLTWSIPSTAGFPDYWDGSQKPRPLSGITEPQHYDNLRDMAPWCGLLGANDVVFAGCDPGQILSFVRSSFVPSREGRPITLSFSLRTVIAPGSTQDFRFFSADLPSPYGAERELVQRVHDAYPQWFQPDPKAPPSIWGVGAHYWMSGKRLEDIPGRAPLEFSRRMHISWEWSYAPFKRAGDHWGEEKWWDYKPLVAFEEKKSARMSQVIDFATLPREDFLKKREDYFNRFHGGFGFMFYTPFAAWMEHTLAEREFPDAIIRDPNHKFDLKYYVTGYDREFLLLPWFTSYEKVVRDQFRKIAETYDIHGFAFDVALGGPRYRPTTPKPDAPRAYDEQGDFIDLGAAAAHVLDYVKTLPARFDPEQRLATVINGMRSFNSSVRGDYGMLEGTPYFSGREQIPLSRYLFGQKPSTWWKGWAYTRFAVPNWQRYDRDHFVKTMRGLVDYTLFSSFEWGNLPTLNYEFGVPKITGTVPLILDSLHRGWQGVFPVTFEWEGSIHTGRYGKGLESRLFWGNPYDDSRTISASVENTYLGDRSYAFASRLNGPVNLENSINSGKTAFTLPIVARNSVLIDAVAALPQDFSGKVDASLMVSDFEIRQVLRISSSTTPGSVSALLPIHGGYDSPRVRTAEREIPVSSTPDGYACEIPVSAEPVEITVSYRSSLLKLAESDLLEFPVFTKDFNPAFTCVTNSRDLLSKMGNDIKLREYLSFYASVVQKKESPEALQIVTDEPSSTPVMAIRFDPQAAGPSISLPSSERLEIVVRSPAELTATLNRLLTVLDKRYPYHPGFIGTWGMDSDLLRHVDMMGKNLESW